MKILILLFLLGTLTNLSVSQTTKPTVVPTTTLQSQSSLVGKYKIVKENSKCSMIWCKCCPDDEIPIKIDKHSTVSSDKMYVIQGEASGILCSESLQSVFEFGATQGSGSLKLFGKNYKLTKNGDRLSFECLDQESCSFVLKKSSEEFAPYDFVVNIDSMLALGTSGWDVTFNNQTDYERKKQKDTIVVGVAGLYNRGKTWFINKIAHNNFQSGFHMHTVGLSMKYADYDTKVASYLDTAGFETPITFFGDTRTTETEETKLRDRHLTEHFIQNFIFERSDIIIVVVGHLSFSDQKLINRILSVYGESSKEIFILHNYFELREIGHVSNLLERDLFGAFSVKVVPLEISKELASQGYFHQEIYVNKYRKNIRHLVTAADGSPAGNYYNPPVYEFFRSLIQSRSPMNNFDILQELATFTKNEIEAYAKPESPQYNIELVREAEALKLKLTSKLKLKPVTFDVNGVLIKKSASDFQADYDFILSDGHVVFTVDLPPIKKSTDTGKRLLNYRWDKHEGKACFTFEAELEEIKPLSPKDQVIVKNRKRGKVRISPPCLESFYDISEKHTSFNNTDNTISIKFKLSERGERQYSIEL